MCRKKLKELIKKSSLASVRKDMTLGALLREGNIIQVMDAIFVNDSNTEVWQVQDEALLELQRHEGNQSKTHLLDTKLYSTHNGYSR
jgi:hypothetical protein